MAKLRHIAEWSHSHAYGYLGLVAIAELLIIYVSPQVGMLLDAVLLIALIVHGSMSRFAAERRLLLALTLAPLTRLLSLSLLLPSIPRLAWYSIVSLPLSIATVLLIRYLRLSRAQLGLRFDNLPLQLMVMCAGLGLGALEYLILSPEPLVGSLSWRDLFVAVLTLMIFTGLVEELIFRGLLQAVALPALQRSALIYVSLLFAVLHVGNLSLVDVCFAFGVGLLFAYVVRWSGSILGVSLAHGLTNVTLFLIIPHIAQRQGDPVAALFHNVMWVGALLAVIAIVIIWHRRGIEGAVPVPASPGLQSVSVSAGPQPEPSLPAASPAGLQPIIERFAVRYRDDRRMLGEASSEDMKSAKDQRRSVETQPSTQATFATSSTSGPETTTPPLISAQHAAMYTDHDRLLPTAEQRDALYSHLRARQARYMQVLSSRWGILALVCSAIVMLAIGIASSTSRRTLGNGNRPAPVSTASPASLAANATENLPMPTTSPQLSASAAAPAGPVIPTSPPLPTTATVPTLMPTAVVPTPTSGARSADDALQQVAAAEAALQTGEFEATLDYGKGNRALSQLSFDLGGAGNRLHMHLTAIYSSTNGTQTTERIAIGDKVWDRQPDGRWAVKQEQQEGLGQLQMYLPHAARVSHAELDRSADTMILRWYDSASDADVLLIVDPTTGIPRELRHVTHASGAILTVTYSGWNMPVTITPPEGS
jgi:uncharacterized protein